MSSYQGPAGTDTAKYYITADYGIETFPSNTVNVQYHGLYEREGELKIVVNDSTKPKYFSLGTNYPNPFNPSTIIKYNIPEVCYVTLKVYNTLGKEIATLVNEIQDAGYKEINFGASANGGLPSGVYFYRLYAGNFVSINKMLLLR
ncbi:MAG: T9SS type A sorting domain-containing protein [Bacteroidota bacterium]|nr:T9SS type A sorting domain-containing protein [Bacteroidota bacterium]